MVVQRLWSIWKSQFEKVWSWNHNEQINAAVIKESVKKTPNKDAYDRYRFYFNILCVFFMKLPRSIQTPSRRLVHIVDWESIFGQGMFANLFYRPMVWKGEKACSKDSFSFVWWVTFLNQNIYTF